MKSDTERIRLFCAENIVDSSENRNGFTGG